MHATLQLTRQDALLTFDRDRINYSPLTTQINSKIQLRLTAMSVLDSKAAFADRLKQLGIEDALKGELQDRGFETFGSLAFAVSTTPQQITDAVLEAWLLKVTTRDLSPYQTSCVRRLVVESHALALNDLQRKVDQPSDPQLAARKLPVAERQSRQTEQEQRLQGLIFSPEIIPSHALVYMCQHGGARSSFLDQTRGLHFQSTGNPVTQERPQSFFRCSRKLED